MTLVWLRETVDRYYFDAGVYAFPQAGLLEKGAASTMAYRINDWVRTLHSRYLSCSGCVCVLNDVLAQEAHYDGEDAELASCFVNLGDLFYDFRRTRSFGGILQ